MKRKIKKIFIFGMIFFIVCLIYGHYEYGNIKITEIELESTEIPDSFDGFKIMFVADFQIDTYHRFNKKYLNKAIDKMNEIDVDLLLIGGDFVNWTGKIDRFYEEIIKLKKPKYGIYTVLGNHEYNDIEKNRKKIKETGFKLLENENQKIEINNDYIFIAGTDDLWHGNPDAKKSMEGITEEDFTIFLTHNPDYFDIMTESDKSKADITMSGHTHGGQVTLFGKVIKAPVKNKSYVKSGLREINGNKLYVTSGLGGSAFEMYVRFFAQPEIVVITLKKEK